MHDFWNSRDTWPLLPECGRWISIVMTTLLWLTSLTNLREKTVGWSDRRWCVVSASSGPERGNALRFRHFVSDISLLLSKSEASKHYLWRTSFYFITKAFSVRVNSFDDGVPQTGALQRRFRCKPSSFSQTTSECWYFRLPSFLSFLYFR